MGGTDPSDDDITGSDYHGENRGKVFLHTITENIKSVSVVCDQLT